MNKRAVQTARLSWNEEGTPMSEQFEDIYFSNQDGLEESRHVFLQGNLFPERFNTHPFKTCVIAETGFGTGLNFLALWQSFNQFKAEHPHAKLQRLHFISFEKYPLSKPDLITAHQCWYLNLTTYHNHCVTTGTSSITRKPPSDLTKWRCFTGLMVW